MDPLCDSWTNIVNIVKYHSDPSKFIKDFLQMKRVSGDILATRKEGSPVANKKMNEFLEMAKEFILVVDDFSLLESYEYGTGFKNIPDNTMHIIDPVSFRPSGKPEGSYLGYGWYLKPLKDIQSTDIVNMNHLMANMDQEDFNRTYVVFSEMKTTACRPCEPPPPRYAGICKSGF